MQIVSIHAWLERIPLTQSYAIAYQQVDHTEIVYLEIALANGIVGYGASNPFAEVIGETPAQTLLHLQSDTAHTLIGRNIEDHALIIQDCYRLFPHYPGTHAAIDIALHDALGKYSQKSVVDMYGRKINALPTSITIGIKPIQEVLRDAQAYVKQGFSVFKLKTGLHVDEDIERVVKMYELLGNRIKLRVDANLGYDPATLQQFLNHTQHIPIELIEQPLPVAESHHLKKYTAEIRSKLVADESLTDLQSAKDLLADEPAFGVFNIKLMKAGGILAAKQIADHAATKNIHLFWGCNDESLISITAALHIAYACPHTRYLDLDGSLDVIEQAFAGGFLLKDGVMYLTDSAGLGVHKK